MPGIFTYAMQSNVPPALRSLCAECLVLQAAQDAERRAIVVDLDADMAFRCRSGKPTRDDPVSRYGRMLGSSEVPVVNRDGFKDLLQDCARSRTMPLENRSLIIFLDKAPVAEALPVVDSLCFMILADNASIPFIYNALQPQRESGQMVAVRVLLVGEPRIEAAAQLFVNLRKELQDLQGKDMDCSFAGTIHFNQDDLDLAAGYQLPFIEAFPEGNVHGQVKYAVKRLFSRDPARVSIDDSIKIKSLGLL